MRLLLLKHFSFDDASVLLTWAKERGCPAEVFEPPSGQPFPPKESFDLLVVLGGPMSVFEEDKHPWLTAEKAFLREAIRCGKRVLGICLGAQMLAEALGGRVYRNGEKEIGWHPVRRTEARHPLLAGLPEMFWSFHWHGDTFELPEGAVHLASSSACRNQAFAFGDRLLGLQFHLETTPACMTAMTEAWADELVPGRWIESAAAMLAKTARCADSAAYLHKILDRMLAAHAGERAAG
ncbi:Glutamine amidotransferase class-I [Thermobacillus xylanilyticus]|jgi:GMP synthase-like glutamine amidotransferase|uniref:Glutamine amidotransferase class-I n=1 Tax=Thermobacillus xylanilyticus TaxID=76633 RepID=A0ABN7SB41_THEXY|nr:type 1 glutamine amidotransferase [Thermobacillus xylanilyticus]CAG5092392.1 Glutamine amidotransferase class-I [Thermobacillus xylanilyticus]